MKKNHSLFVCNGKKIYIRANSYWTATPYGSSHAYYIRFYNNSVPYTTDDYWKNSSKYYIRPVTN